MVVLVYVQIHDMLDHALHHIVAASGLLVGASDDDQGQQTDFGSVAARGPDLQITEGWKHEVIQLLAHVPVVAATPAGTVMRIPGLGDLHEAPVDLLYCPALVLSGRDARSQS